jgi:hypothetical protein
VRVRATARGRDLYATAREVIADVDREWATRFGATKMCKLGELRQKLNEWLAARDTET